MRFLVERLELVLLEPEQDVTGEVRLQRPVDRRMAPQARGRAHARGDEPATRSQPGVLSMFSRQHPRPPPNALVHRLLCVACFKRGLSFRNPMVQPQVNKPSSSVERVLAGDFDLTENRGSTP